jgi:lipopolysaccharide transport system permease protein
MRARYHSLEAAAAPTGADILVRFELENCSRAEYSADDGYHIGWQVYDPDTATFITEGQWIPLETAVPAGSRRTVEARVALPEQDGPYRVYVSLIHEQRGWLYNNGGPLALIDAAVADGRAAVNHSRITTIARLRRENWLRSFPHLFKQPFESMWNNRTLVASMARRDVLARYRGSFGDVFWTILNPLLLMATYFFVFGIVLRTRFAGDESRTGFALYFLAGMLPWLAFSEPVGRSPHVVLEHRNFVKKLVFPVDTLPVVQVLSGFATEIFAIAIYICGLLILRGTLYPSIIWLPALIIPQLLLTLGLCWFLAALGAYVRDLGQVMGFLLTLWFFITPICYPETHLPPAAAAVLGKNPMFTLVRGYRAIFLEGHAPEWHSLWKLWLLSGAVFFFGYAWFHKLRRSFADVI